MHTKYQQAELKVLFILKCFEERQGNSDSLAAEMKRWVNIGLINSNLEIIKKKSPRFSFYLKFGTFDSDFNPIQKGRGSENEAVIPADRRFKNKVLLPISWEKGVQDSRIQGVKCLFPNDFIRAFSILSTSPKTVPLSHLGGQAKALIFGK